MTSNRKPSICFVTNELYPLGPGGIGRVLYNFAKHNMSIGAPADLHYLVPLELMEKRPDAHGLLADAFQNAAEIHVCPALDRVPDVIAQLLACAANHPWTLEWQLANSYSFYLGLLAAEHKRGTPFDIVEFPDFGGWAVASVEAKRAGLAFRNTLFSVRIHSTQGVLYRVERFAHHPGNWIGILLDSERHLLAHADLIVGHDRAIMDFNETHYDLSERWRGRRFLEFPPILLDKESKTSGKALADKQEAKEERVDSDSDFIFSSRLQQFKRPDIFIRAAVAFLEKHSYYEGHFRLVSYGWDQAYIAGLQALVPEEFKEKILFVFEASAAERNAYLKRSIVVVPSDYESLCLFAFEAAEMGCKVILNERCPAFGESNRWRDGENCLLFDGSVEGLAAEMERALVWNARACVDATPDLPYWLCDDIWNVAAPANQIAAHTGVSVVCYGFESRVEFDRHFSTVVHIEGALDLSDDRNEIRFFLPRALFSPDGTEARRIKERGWKADFTSGLRECPETFGRRLKALKKEHIFLYPSGYEALPDFLKRGLVAFAHDPSIALFGGHVELIDPHTAKSDYLRAFAGEAPSHALLSSRIVPPLCLLRRNLLDRVSFDSRAGDLWFEVFARECTLKGEIIVIAPFLAASLDGLHAGKRETTKKISGAMLDMVGMKARLSSRLLAIDPVQPPGDGPDRPYVIDGDKLRAASRIHPKGVVREWEPVIFRGDVGGALVHPLAGEITIAELRGPHRRISRIATEVRNIHVDNGGAEAAIALAPEDTCEEEILQFIQNGGEAPGLALSAWSRLGPRGEARIELPVNGASRGRDRLLLLTRLPINCDEANCHLVFQRVEAWFNENLL